MSGRKAYVTSFGKMCCFGGKGLCGITEALKKFQVVFQNNSNKSHFGFSFEENFENDFSLKNSGAKKFTALET